MTTTYGLTEQGFVPQPMSVIVAGIVTRLRARFGNSLPVDESTVEGEFTNIIGERLALCWEILEQIVNASDPDKALGAFLEAICMITGTTRTPATYSVVVETLVGDDGSVFPSGSIIANASNGKQFITTTNATLVLLDTWLASATYALGDRVSNGGNSYLCIAAGVAAGSGGPTTTASDITDGTAHWRYLGTGLSAVDTVARATVTGPIFAASGDLTNIVTTAGGVNSAINILDCALGSDKMSDAALRQLRDYELAQPGTSPADSVRAALLKVAGVTTVTVFNNPSDSVDIEGVPPHALECLVQGGADQDIFDCLRKNVAGGIRSYGSTAGFSTDKAGKPQPQAFTRPENVLIYATITLEKFIETYPPDGNDQVKIAIVEDGDAQPTGKNATAWRIGASAAKVAGINEVTGVLLSAYPVTVPVASTTIQISTRQLAVFDTSRISVISTDGTP